jgi:hypothetical protein
MALTESKIRRIIREEAARVMKEAPHGAFGGMYDRGSDDEWDDDAARDHFDRDFDDDSDDEYDAIKDYAAVTGRDKMDVFHDRMSGRLGSRRRY